MARFSDEVINRIKTEVSLMRLIETQGYRPKKQGKDYALHCPFHEDDTPSLIITPKSNLFHCFGCDAAGSVIDWVMKIQGVSFRHAVEILQEGNPSLAAVSDAVVKRSQRKKLEPLASTDTDNQVLLGKVVDYYHEALKQSPEALDYLHVRGLGDPRLIDTFKLGYANRTLGYRLPAKCCNAGKSIRKQLQDIGLLRSSGHEHFNGSIVVPVLDENHNVLEVYGRKTHNNLRAGTPKHLYLPGPHCGVWNASGLVGQQEVILCEALLDAMTFWCAGYENVTASYGTSGFTDEHLALFKQLNIARVLIAYDRDEAGNKAAEKLAKKLQAEGIDCYRVLFPKKMDANEYALQVQPAAKSIGVVIRSAEWIGEGDPPQPLTSTVVPGAESKTAAKKEKSELSVDTIPLLAANAIEPEAAPTLPAKAVPPSPVDPVAPEINEHEIVINFSDRRYRVRGLQKNTSYEVLKVNVLMQCGEAIHVDTFDMYSAKHRQSFARVAAAENGLEDKVIQRDLGQLLLQLEGLQDKSIQEGSSPL